MSAAACEFIAHLFERFALHGRTKAGGEGKGGEMRDAMSRKAVKGGLDWMISSLPDVRPGSYGLARWHHGRWKAGVEGLRDGNGLISGFTLSCSGRLWAGPLARLGTWHPPRPLAILGNRISRRPRAPRLATARLISKRPRPCIPHAPPPALGCSRPAWSRGPVSPRPLCGCHTGPNFCSPPVSAVSLTVEFRYVTSPPGLQVDRHGSGSTRQINE